MTNIEDYGFMDFKILHEDYCEYKLEDGTIIRTRAILLKVLKDGSDFSLNERSFAASFSPQKSRGAASSTKLSIEDMVNLKDSIKIPDIDIITTKEHWNEYELSNGEKIYSKAVLVSASLTDKYDDVGEPVYLLQLQVLHKFNLK